MITHICLYGLTEEGYLPLVRSALEEMKNCPLIVENGVHEAIFEPAEVAGPVLHATIAHIATFQTEEDALAYPNSPEHLVLVQKTGKYIRHVMTMDYVRETDA